MRQKELYTIVVQKCPFCAGKAEYTNLYSLGMNTPMAQIMNGQASYKYSYEECAHWIGAARQYMHDGCGVLLCCEKCKVSSVIRSISVGWHMDGMEIVADMYGRFGNVEKQITEKQTIDVMQDELDNPVI